MDNINNMALATDAIFEWCSVGYMYCRMVNLSFSINLVLFCECRKAVIAQQALKAAVPHLEKSAFPFFLICFL